MATPTTSERPPRNIATRVFAALALIAVLVAVIAVISSGLSGSDEKDGERRERRERVERTEPEELKSDVYVVEPGDTVTSISEKTGVSIEAIEQLNPELDAQTLNSGQEIKLR